MNRLATTLAIMHALCPEVLQKAVDEMEARASDNIAPFQGDVGTCAEANVEQPVQQEQEQEKQGCYVKSGTRVLTRDGVMHILLGDVLADGVGHLDATKYDSSLNHEGDELYVRQYDIVQLYEAPVHAPGSLNPNEKGDLIWSRPFDGFICIPIDGEVAVLRVSEFG